MLLAAAAASTASAASASATAAADVVSVVIAVLLVLVCCCWCCCYCRCDCCVSHVVWLQIFASFLTLLSLPWLSIHGVVGLGVCARSPTWLAKASESRKTSGFTFVCGQKAVTATVNVPNRQQMTQCLARIVGRIGLTACMKYQGSDTLNSQLVQVRVDW